ncbi:serine protease persephone-like isoform X2 [Planococcus citri]|uniref:serine protease persephone-like isoform X2 n=1 Tax=Planococcus citri TaxID=170843 RepID=UPI0031F782E7
MSVRRISMFRDSMIPILQVFLLAYLCNGQAKEFQEYGKYGYVKKGQDSKLPSENFVNASTLIAGGTPAEAKEFPHMALIGYGKEFKSVWWGCGGSLISEKFIMSAAHCTVNTDLGPPQWVLLGALNELATKDDPQRKVYSIVKVHNHPEYNSNSLYHDISLFQLNTTVEFSPYVRLACLHTSTADFPAKTTASITGWGLTGACRKYLGLVLINIKNAETHFRRTSLSWHVGTIQIL